MALERLKNDDVYRFRLAFRHHFADWQNPTAAELNANSDNSDPLAAIMNPTCALNTDGSQFDLDDSELDESLTFCQTAGNAEVLNRSATVVFQYEMAKTPWSDATSTAAVDGYNTANLTHAWLAWKGVGDLFAIMSVGKDVDQPFAVGDPIRMYEVATDYAVPDLATGANITWTQTFAKRSDLLHNYRIAS